MITSKWIFIKLADTEIYVPNQGYSDITVRILKVLLNATIGCIDSLRYIM
jgi:hypothetical protein